MTDHDNSYEVTPSLARLLALGIDRDLPNHIEEWHASLAAGRMTGAMVDIFVGLGWLSTARDPRITKTGAYVPAPGDATPLFAPGGVAAQPSHAGEQATLADLPGKAPDAPEAILEATAAPDELVGDALLAAAAPDPDEPESELTGQPDSVKAILDRRAKEAGEVLPEPEVTPKRKR